MAILSLLLLAALVTVILANLLSGTQASAVTLVFWSKAAVPLGYVIALAALTGALVTWLAALPKHVSRFWAIRKLEATVAERQRAFEALAQETARLRTGSVSPPPAVQGEYQPPSP
ncbi:MAG: LapA family protein [bacterium]|nr:LapA family protein [bacterium]